VLVATAELVPEPRECRLALALVDLRFECASFDLALHLMERTLSRYKVAKSPAAVVAPERLAPDPDVVPGGICVAALYGEHTVAGRV